MNLEIKFIRWKEILEGKYVKIIKDGNPPDFDTKIAKELGLPYDLDFVPIDEYVDWTIDGYLCLAYGDEYHISSDWSWLSLLIDEHVKIHFDNLFLYHFDNEEELKEFLDNTSFLRLTSGEKPSWA